MIKFDIIKQWLQPEKPGWHFSSRLLLSVESLNSGKRRFSVNHATEKISTFEKQNDRSIFQCVCNKCRMESFRVTSLYINMSLTASN